MDKSANPQVAAATRKKKVWHVPLPVQVSRVGRYMYKLGTYLIGLSLYDDMCM
jgi:hypothetical protein